MYCMIVPLFTRLYALPVYVGWPKLNFNYYIWQEWDFQHFRGEGTKDFAGM